MPNFSSKHHNKPKAVALLSGGLDSLLAAKLVLEQGVHVEGINFFTGFCVEGHTHALRKHHQNKNKRNNALWCAEKLGIKLHIIDIVEEYKQVVLNPQYGYGANLNPCLDCKIFMINHAKQWLAENNFDFIITGEVAGQRPKSQTRAYLDLVAEKNQVGDILLRPLSAKNLLPTLPERNGWIDRNKLEAISGRSRKRQIEMAEKYGFSDYAQPAGGCCFLTDKFYAQKLKDLWQHRGKKAYELDDVLLLKVGRHLRPSENYKLIIGREEGENNFLEGYRHSFIHMRILSHNGPLVLIDGKFLKSDEQYAAKIAARFSDGKNAEQVTVQLNYCDGSSSIRLVKPFSETEINKDWYL